VTDKFETIRSMRDEDKGYSTPTILCNLPRRRRASCNGIRILRRQRSRVPVKSSSTYNRHIRSDLLVECVNKRRASIQVGHIICCLLSCRLSKLHYCNPTIARSLAKVALRNSCPSCIYGIDHLYYPSNLLLMTGLVLKDGKPSEFYQSTHEK